MAEDTNPDLLFDLPANSEHSVLWNPWHGCRRYSEGCRNCYVYRIDASHGKDASKIAKNKSFGLPLAKNRNGGYKLPYGSMVYVCFSSDFFLEDADQWRQKAWEAMLIRKDLSFFLTTKRITRAIPLLPKFWEEIKSRVEIACTVEDQSAADSRIPAYLSFPAARRTLICEPLLGFIDFGSLKGIDKVIAGGESGPEARICRHEWVLDIRRQCLDAGVSFSFKQTGANFIKDGKLFKIPRNLQHCQAKKAGIDIL